MPPLSLRDYLKALDELGDLERIEREVDPELEAAAIARRSFERYAPAPLIERVRGHAGFRILSGVAPFSSLPHARYARVALALGLDAATPATEIVQRLATTLDAEPIPPRVIDAGPCQQRTVDGLHALPQPTLHEGDGGRYLNSIGTVIARTPDGEWTNWHIARCMVIDSQRMNIWTAPVQHFGMIHRMWAKRGEPMPVAVVQGPEPAATALSGMPIPRGVDEVGVLGAWFGEPLELVHCQTVDLDVPASAEIVIEGHLAVAERTQEGPFGEYHGYLMGEPHPQLVCEITAITHREEAILPICPAGKPVDDDHTLVGLGGGAEFLHRLRAEGVPASSALLVPETAVHLGVVTVPSDWRARTGLGSSAELCRRIGEILMETKNQVWMSRLMVFDDDIDPADLRDVAWGFTTRCHAVHGQVTIEDRLCSPLTPVYTPEERARFHGPLAIHDCLLAPGDHRPRVSSFTGAYPESMRERVLAAERG